MIRTPVTSSAVLSLGYEDGVLEVEYHNSGVYRMTGISQAQYDALLGATSISLALNVLRAICRAVTKVEPEVGRS